MKKLICGLAVLLFTLSLGLPLSASAEDSAVTAACNSVVRLVMIGKDGATYTGSAFAVGKKGQPVQYFVTCDHCVSNTGGAPAFAKIYVVLNSLAKQDKDTIYLASVVYCTNQLRDGPDFAVIKIATPIKARVAMALKTKSQVKVSDEVFAIGFPAAADTDETIPSTIEDMSVTRGIISKLTIGDGQWTANYQTDCAINHGNSGGPLVDSQGNAIGISAFGMPDATNINGAVQIDNVIPILDKNKIPYELAGKTSASSTGVSASSTNGSKASSAVSGAASSKSGSSKPFGGLFSGSNLPIIAIIVVVLAAGGIVAAILLTHRGTAQPMAPNSAPAPSQPAMPANQPVVSLRPVLQGTGSLFSGQTMELSGGKIIIGRDPARCNLVFPVDTPGISGVHCEIEYAGGRFILRDLGSTYGTFLSNGTKLTPMLETALPQQGGFYLAGSENSFVTNII